VTVATLKSSKDFWEEKARENPYWYVSTYGPYANRNQSEFWTSGEAIWGELKERVGYQPERSHTVAEIGCGVGRLTRAIVQDGVILHSFDISAGMLACAKEAVPSGASFHLTDGSSLRPMSDRSADLVLAYCVFQHLPSERVLSDYLVEMVRVAKPGGRIAFTTSPHDWRTYLLPLARAKAALIARIRADGPKGLYKKEWVGIRPSRHRVRALCPIPLQFVRLPGDRWLYFGKT
jgi:SAM-dependent methyltransferase